MEPSAYCRDCLILVAMARTPEDRQRLDVLLDAWRSGGELAQREGRCERCGHYKEVSYYHVTT